MAWGGDTNRFTRVLCLTGRGNPPRMMVEARSWLRELLKPWRLLPTVGTMSLESGTRRALESFKRHGRVVSTTSAILVSTAGVVGCAASAHVKTPSTAPSATTPRTEPTSTVSTSSTLTTTTEETTTSTERAATAYEPNPPIPTSPEDADPAPVCSAKRPVVVLIRDTPAARTSALPPRSTAPTRSSDSASRSSQSISTTLASCPSTTVERPVSASPCGVRRFGSNRSFARTATL